MGYTTHLEGKFDLSRELSQEELGILSMLKDEGIPHYVLCPRDPSPFGYCYCQWVVVPAYGKVDGDSGTFVNESDRQVLAWDQREKFYDYVTWLRYLIKEYFAPWGVLLNGEVEWSGDDEDDLGKIYLQDNFMEVYEGIVHVEYVKVKEEDD